MNPPPSTADPQPSIPAKVAEVFQTAGIAFQRLSELTLALHATGEPSNENMRWTDDDIQRMHSAITKFAGELEAINDSVQSRTVTQMKTDLKRKVALGDNITVDDYSAKKSTPANRGGNRGRPAKPGTPQLDESYRNAARQPNMYIHANDNYTADVGPPSF